MKRILFSLILAFACLSVFAQTEVKKVAILETVDKMGNVPYGILFQVRSSLTFAISSHAGYEGYDRVDMTAITGEQSFQRTGMVSDEQIKRVGEMTGAAYVLIAEAALYDDQNIIIAAKILDVETGGVMSSTPPAVAPKDPTKMAEACVKCSQTLVGGKMPTQNTMTSSSYSTLPSSAYNKPTSDIIISKRLLQERGFRFPTVQQEAIATLKTGVGEQNIICSTWCASNLNNARCYGTSSNEDCYIDGLALINGNNEYIILGYIVCGELAYPYLTFSSDGEHYFVGIDELGCSYGCAYHPNWDSSNDRPMCKHMKKIFGNHISSIDFIENIVNLQVYLPDLKKSFEDFLRNGGKIDCIWECDD